MVNPLFLMEDTLPRLDEVEQHYLLAKQKYLTSNKDLLVTTIIPSLVIANAPQAFRSGINPSLNVFNFMIVSIVTSGLVIPLMAMLIFSIPVSRVEDVDSQSTHHERSCCEGHDE